MSFFNLKKTMIATAIGLTIMIVGSSDANAQSRRQYERNNRATYDRRSEQRIVNVNFAHGYQYGYAAGISDRRRGKYNRSNVYRDTPVTPFQGDPTNIDYIYRQGYLAGYNDGFYGRRNY